MQCRKSATRASRTAASRIVMPVFVMGSMVLSAGVASCGGPSMRGIEARKAANDRFDRTNAQVVYDQARQALATGQFEVALTQIDRAIERYPKDANYLVLRGRILIEQRRMHAAKETLDRAVEVNPKSAEAQYFLGVLAQRCDDNAAALEHYEKARELDPKNLQFIACCAELQLALGHPVEARQLIEKSASSFEYNPVLQHIRASCLAMEGRPVEAAAVMQTAFARNPTDPALAEDLVNALFDAGEWAECLQALDHPVLVTERNRPDMQRTRARCLMMMNRAVEARDLLVMNAPSGESTVEHLVTLGYAAWCCGDWARVAACGETLVSAHPRLPDGYLFLGAVERERGNLLASERWLEQASARGESRDLVVKLRSRVQTQLAQRREMAEGG